MSIPRNVIRILFVGSHKGGNIAAAARGFADHGGSNFKLSRISPVSRLPLPFPLLFMSSVIVNETLPLSLLLCL